MYYFSCNLNAPLCSCFFYYPSALSPANTRKKYLIILPEIQQSERILIRKEVKKKVHEPIFIRSEFRDQDYNFYPKE